MLYRSLLSLLLSLPALAQTVADSNLKVQTWVDGFDNPTGAAFVNDSGDALVLEKNTGKVRLLSNRAIGKTVLDLPVSNDSERGLLGIALSPGFSGDHFVYLYYTASSVDGGQPISNSVKRYLWSPSQQKLTFDRKIVDLPATPGPNHDGGRMVFGADGKLYIGTGELNRNEQTTNHTGSQTVNRVASILRVNPSGSSVSANPFYDIANKGTARAPLNDIYAYGIRNSFGIAIDPVTGHLWQSENGPASFDEINRITPGFNGGWENLTGPASRNGGTGALVSLGAKAHYEDPKFAWSTPVAPTEMFFMPTARLGGQYKNDLFVGSVRGGKIFRFELSPSRKTLALDGDLADLVADNSLDDRFAEQDSILWGDNFGTVTDMMSGPGGIYVVSLSTGAIFRITTNSLPRSVPEPSSAVVGAIAFLVAGTSRPRFQLRRT